MESNKDNHHIVDVNKKISSVEWLISQLQKSKDWHRILNEISQMSSAKIDIIEQAKAMHKEEQKIAYHAKLNKDYFDFEHFYQQTYGE